MLELIAFAKRMMKKGATGAGFNIATPLYGTRLYEEVVKKGYFDVNTDPSRLSISEAHMQTPDWTKEELMVLKGFATWSVNLSLIGKITYPLKNPRKVFFYARQFILNRI